ncbi:hypothetical protein Rsub_06938 [Raphidocelis subcapitata]|uniref:Coenzyme Q-binding protein COQ10 START domain-containing protein n=1 Tax=Raphidocelis subcapitata TaxID=307507 RepID=A0A2V0P381_9CHLO|nr:hypothetical protein Rsub_06938 [Raphidocelis subcapitata]|eukprot:GBF94316.1 hypothetical protein Rsub_06938 [Raphidocelis subcapitata]
MPAAQHGVSSSSAAHYKATVSNASGYMCRIQVECNFNVPPETLFEIFTHPDNSVAFRDIRKVGYRKVLSNRPGHKIVEVEQVGSMRILWGLERSFTTLLRVEEDSRDPSCLLTKFDLVRSDVLAKFHGAWRIAPVTDPVTGAVTGCRGHLEQEVLPRGVPPFLAHLPILGGRLRGASLNTIRRLVEDITTMVEKTRADGRSVGDVIDEMAAARGHAHSHAGPDWGGNGAVQSFRISADGGVSSEDPEDGGGGSGGGGGGLGGTNGGGGGGGKGAGPAGGGGAGGRSGGGALAGAGRPAVVPGATA